MGLCYSCVPSGTVQMVEQFGKYKRVAPPGFNCVVCCIGEAVAGKLSLRVQQLDVRCETKTKDNVFVALTISVQYQVMREGVEDAFYKLTDSRSQIFAYVTDVVRATVPRMLLDDVFIAKTEIAQDVKEQLTKSMSSYGYSIISCLATDVDPDARVRAAMNEINAAQRMRVAALEKAEADKVQVVKAAEADAESKFLAGQGVARQRKAIVAGLRESVSAFERDITDINSRDVIELMLMTQYFDTLDRIGTHGRGSTIFIPSTPGGINDVAGQIRSGFMQANAAQPAAQGMSRV